MTDRCGITTNLVQIAVTETPCCFRRVRYPPTTDAPISIRCPGCGEPGMVHPGVGSLSIAIEVTG